MLMKEKRKKRLTFNSVVSGEVVQGEHDKKNEYSQFELAKKALEEKYEPMIADMKLKNEAAKADEDAL